MIFGFRHRIILARRGRHLRHQLLPPQPAQLQAAIRGIDARDLTESEAERLTARIIALPTEARDALNQLLKGV